MASVAEARRSPFSADPHNPNLHKSIPILPSSGSTLAPPRERDRDAMDITPTSASAMGPPTDRNGASAFQSHSQREANGDSGNTSPNGNAAPAVGAAAAAQQPKVVQTAFIHKLYKWVCRTIATQCDTNTGTACSRTRASSTSFPGRAQTRALSCRPPASSPRSCRTYLWSYDLFLIYLTILAPILSTPISPRLSAN